MASLFGLSNIYLFMLAADYFSASIELNVFVHTWSLGVEEQFYFLFPLLFWFCGFNRPLPYRSRKLVLAAAVLTIASLVSFIIVYPSNRPTAYFLMPTRLWELGAGCALYLGLARTSQTLAHFGRLFPGAVVAALVGCLFIPLEHAVPATIAVVILSALAIASLRKDTASFGLLTSSPALYVGRISYSLYLWHWGVISLSWWTVGIHLWSVPFQLALMFILAAVSYHLIETPLRSASWSSSRVLSLGYGIASAVAAAACLYMLSGPIGGQLYLGRLLDLPTPSNLQLTWWIDRKTGKYLERCHVQYRFSTALLDECLGSTSAAQGTVFLIGDSHARNYLPAVRTAFEGYHTVYMTMGYGCGFLPPALSAPYANVRCAEYSAEVAQYLVSHAHRGDVVVVGQRLYREAERQKPPYFEFIGAFAEKLSRQDVPLVLLDGIYPADWGPELCMPLPWRPGDYQQRCSVSADITEKSYARFDQLATEATHRMSNLFYAPLRTGLCHAGTCGQTTESGVPVWHDREHITEAVSAELAPLLRDDLVKQDFFTRFPPPQ